VSVSLLFNKDPMTRTTQIFHYDDSNDTFTIEDRQDVTEVLEANKRDYNEATRYRLPQLGDTGRLGRRVANVPLNILAQWRREWRLKNFSHEEREQDLKKKLNDPDIRLFRTDASVL
jgi:hypothetical protein